ncbi:MAG: tRNA guanosine(34) transglycosylase Tgt [Candidatus Paceibacterota bacterium]
MQFKIEKKLKNSLGRVGVLTTPHGEIKTPAFVAVGTKATVKSLNPEQVKDAGVQVVLGNTYHLYLQPGDEIVRDAGGIGKFMNWSGPTMTDSGGFQVFSLGVAYGKDISKIAKITDSSLLIPERFDDSDAPRLAKIGQDGVSFKSHLDGSIYYITPEKSIQIQHNLGADIIFAFDECTSPVEDLKYQEEALERTHRWAERSLKEHQKLLDSPLEEYPKGEVDEFSTPSRKRATPQEGNFKPALFGIVQGGREKSLRKQSAKIIAEINVDGKYFDGFGIGGSFAKEDMSSAVKWVNEILPEEKPRHLLGIGEPEDFFMGIENGVDLFDCVLPTRLGRNGTIYTKFGKIIITNTKFRNDFLPIEKDCECYTCKNYTKSYIAHLFHGKEMLAGTLASIHNLYFITHLVDNIRESIINDTFYEYKKEFLQNYKSR